MNNDTSEDRFNNNGTPSAKRNDAIYIAAIIISLLAWAAFCLSLLYSSYGLDPLENRFVYIYPFNKVSIPGLWAYDVSEFILYGVVLPAAATAALWKRFFGAAEKLKKRITEFFLLFPVIMGLLITSYIYDYVISMLYLEVIKIMTVCSMVLIFLLNRMYSRRMKKREMNK